MTTIAYRNGVLASDSASTVELAHTNGVRKIFRLSDGSLIGFSGTLSRFLKWLEWHEDEDGPEPSLMETNAIRVWPNGRLATIENGAIINHLKRSDYAAIGTGSEFALGAMAHGAGARAAVAAAIQHDALSRGPVVSLRLRRQS